MSPLRALRALALGLAVAVIVVLGVPVLFGWVPLPAHEGDAGASPGTLLVVAPLDPGDAVEPGQVVLSAPTDSRVVARTVQSVEGERVTLEGPGGTIAQTDRARLRGVEVYRIPLLGHVVGAVPAEARAWTQRGLAAVFLVWIGFEVAALVRRRRDGLDVDEPITDEPAPALPTRRSRALPPAPPATAADAASSSGAAAGTSTALARSLPASPPASAAGRRTDLSAVYAELAVTPIPDAAPAGPEARARAAYGVLEPARRPELPSGSRATSDAVPNALSPVERAMAALEPGRGSSAVAPPADTGTTTSSRPPRSEMAAGESPEGALPTRRARARARARRRSPWDRATEAAASAVGAVVTVMRSATGRPDRSAPSAADAPASRSSRRAARSTRSTPDGAAPRRGIRRRSIEPRPDAGAAPSAPSPPSTSSAAATAPPESSAAPTPLWAERASHEEVAAAARVQDFESRRAAAEAAFRLELDRRRSSRSDEH